MRRYGCADKAQNASRHRLKERVLPWMLHQVSSAATPMSSVPTVAQSDPSYRHIGCRSLGAVVAAYARVADARGAQRTSALVWSPLAVCRCGQTNRGVALALRPRTAPPAHDSVQGTLIAPCVCAAVEHAVLVRELPVQSAEVERVDGPHRLLARVQDPLQVTAAAKRLG